MSLTIAVPKGRLIEPSLEVLKSADIDIELEQGRDLIYDDDDFQLILSKPRDVPVYVEHGIDMGISATDIVEERKSDVFVPLELDFGKCRLSVAVPEEKKVCVDDFDGYSIATEYPNIVDDYFNSMDLNVDVIKLNGSIEVAPRIGIADAIVDIVETGNTLKANNLKEIEKIMNVSAILIVNRISQKVMFDRINEIVKKIKEDLVRI
ncbi:MAG: ATP phosphoribosyltransferase [Thermoplasmatota archaeon]